MAAPAASCHFSGRRDCVDRGLRSESPQNVRRLRSAFAESRPTFAFAFFNRLIPERYVPDPFDLFVAVDDWIYSEVANTFLFDESMLERLRELNPHSAHSLVQRLLEANGRGYWDVDESVLEKLREISRSLEDQLEGVV